MDAARNTPASTTAPWVSATMSRVWASCPETTFRIVSKRCRLSPGLIRFGENATVKSRPPTNPELCSRTGRQSSSVEPG